MRYLLILLSLLFSMAVHAGPVNINSADQDRLDDELMGIGPALAARIVKYREAHGPFKRPEDIQNVPYIGIKTYEKNRDYILLSDS